MPSARKKQNDISDERLSPWGWVFAGLCVFLGLCVCGLATFGVWQTWGDVPGVLFLFLGATPVAYGVSMVLIVGLGLMLAGVSALVRLMLGRRSEPPDNLP